MNRIPKIVLLSGLVVAGLQMAPLTAAAQNNKKAAPKTGAAAVKATGYTKLRGGVSFKLLKDVPGKNAAMGDVVEMHVLAMVDTLPGKTLVLADTRRQMEGKPVPERVQEIKEPGQFQVVLPYLSAGDSVEIHVSCDTILATVPDDAKPTLPGWLKPGNEIKMTLAIATVKPLEVFEREMAAKQDEQMQEAKSKEAQQAPKDDRILQEYFAKNNIKPIKTASGLYYTIEKRGTGPNAQPGEMVSMSYIGTTLSGKRFDGNVESDFKPSQGKAPFTFPLGQGQVIRGWDEGIALLSKGTRARLFIPSPLAYGAQAMGNDIPANSILIFDVEVVDIAQGDTQQFPIGR